MVRVQLFGTTTSPYVRRVRIVAHELGLPVELVDTSTEAGQIDLREASPVWKVPAARVIDGDARAFVMDSGVINALLLQRHGPGPLAPYDPLDVEQHNLLTVVDGALDALINVFYLAKDGVTPEQSEYLAKQRARAASACAWLDGQVDALLGERPSLAAIALGTTVDWMRFRDTYPVDEHAGLVRVATKLAERPSFQATRPGVAV